MIHLAFHFVSMNVTLAMIEVSKSFIGGVHHMKHVQYKAVHFTFTKDATSECLEVNAISISVGDWCAVKYGGMVYPGEVK